MTRKETHETSPQLPFEGGPIEAPREPRVALVHVLTPEFHNLNPQDFADIDPAVVERASATEIKGSLLDTNTKEDEHSRLQSPQSMSGSVVGYRSPNGWVRLALTPKEYGLFSRYVGMLARTAFNRTLDSRDKKLQEETGDPSARARTDEDIAAANRSSIRNIKGKLPKMEGYIATDILPRLETIDRFIEMTKNRNLNRGNHDTVHAHFEHLRLYVFGDMLDAVGNQRGWTAKQAAQAERILQRKLYIEGSAAGRTQNFKAMLEVAKEYYGHKYAFVLTRIAETQKYIRDNPTIVADVAAKDEERAREQ
jgi:hypothetical protein